MRWLPLMSTAVLSILLMSTEATTAQSPGPTADGWVSTVLPQSLGDAYVVGVAVGPSSMVAVGQRACVARRQPGGRCWGQAWTSPDGIDWTAADARTSGLDLGINRPTTSGPEIGLEGVAHGPAGFLAFGRIAVQGGQRSAVWRSDDGSTWERLTAADAFPAAARLRTILGADDGYLLGGVVYHDNAPRAAIWSSSDGTTWTRAQAREVFEIGGYIDTMEDPAAGGINAFALYPGPTDSTGQLADGVAGVGMACMPSFDEDPWAWGGACWGQLWRSPDGRTWTKDEGRMPRPHAAIRSLAAVGDRLVVEAPICFDRCGSAVLLSHDGESWQVPYGSPVGGELWALAAQGTRFAALLTVSDAGDAVPGDSLAVWLSDDGSDWVVDATHPLPPMDGILLFDAAMAVAGDRLVVTASGESAAEDGAAVSMVLVSPPLE